MAQDVDIASTRAEELAGKLQKFLNHRFHIAVVVRDVRDGLMLRIDQVRKPKNHHLVEVRPVEVLPPAQSVKPILVVTPAELIATQEILPEDDDDEF